jgi:hypothetical protein
MRAPFLYIPQIPNGSVDTLVVAAFGNIGASCAFILFIRQPYPLGDVLRTFLHRQGMTEPSPRVVGWTIAEWASWRISNSGCAVSHVAIAVVVCIWHGLSARQVRSGIGCHAHVCIAVRQTYIDQ